MIKLIIACLQPELKLIDCFYFNETFVKKTAFIIWNTSSLYIKSNALDKVYVIVENF